MYPSRDGKYVMPIGSHTVFLSALFFASNISFLYVYLDCIFGDPITSDLKLNSHDLAGETMLDVCKKIVGTIEKKEYYLLHVSGGRRG